MDYDIKQYVIKYLLDRYKYDFTEEINSTPWHKIVGYSFDAHAYYKEKGWYYSLDEVKPVEGMFVHIRREGRTDNYLFERGRWVFAGNMDDESYK